MNTRTDLNATKTSKQRQDDMYARLAAKEAVMAANHQRYLELMAHFDKAEGKGR